MAADDLDATLRNIEVLGEECDDSRIGPTVDGALLNVHRDRVTIRLDERTFTAARFDANGDLHIPRLTISAAGSLIDCHNGRMPSSRPLTARHLELNVSPFVPTSFWLTVLGPGLAGIAALAIVILGTALGFDGNATWAMVGIVLVGLAAAWIGYGAYRGRLRRSTLTRVQALTAIARKHDLIFLSEQLVPDLISSAFGHRSGARVYDSMNSFIAGELSMGTYERSTRPSGSGFFEDWGYLALRLNRKLPNILLESRASRSVFADTDLIGSPRGNQRLSLEGDFDRHFRLYCPAGYEQDALYLFTPDLMALLIDEAGDLSVQLIDDVAFFFSAKPFDLTDERLTDRLLRIADVVGAKALPQTARYSDGRSEEADVVAEEGRRLTRRIPRWPTLTLWYSAQLLLGLGIAWVVLVIRLGVDPGQWSANSQIPWW